MSDSDTQFYGGLRFWPTWLLIYLLKFLAKRRHDTLIRLGQVLGKLGYWLVPRRRHIAETNIRLCFPDLDAADQKKLVEQTLIDSMTGFLEANWAWYGDISQLSKNAEIEGLENLQQALALGRGVLLVGAHYTSVDVGGPLLSQFGPTNIIYMQQKNALLDKYVRDGRLRNLDGVVERSDMRGMIRALKAGKILWYPPDQDHGAKHSVFAPFFGINAASLKITGKLAAVNNSPVVIVSLHRKASGESYVLRFREPLEDFPTGSERQDAEKINKLLETEIRRCPSQYMWVHRRFKSRPEGEPSVY